MFSKPLSARIKTVSSILETFTMSRGPTNMFWEPVHMSGTLLPCHESLILYILSHFACPDRLLALPRGPFLHLESINNVFGSC
jgi:hypothetical protein